MLYARDRWQEAQFFLRLLRESKGEQPSFRYFLSALVSASRSIGLVLQADLRGRVPNFDEWWESARTRISEDRISFEALRNTRNELQKRGNRLPIKMRLEYDSGPLLSSDLTMCPTMEAGEFLSIELIPRPGELPQLSGLSGASAEVQERALQEHMAAVTSDLIARLSTVPAAARSMRSFRLIGSDRDLSFSELIDAMQDHLASWDLVLSDAEGRFGAL